MFKNFFYLTVLSLGLVACGNNKDNNNPVYTGGAYGYTQPIVPNLCSPQVADDWNRLIASRCNNVRSNDVRQGKFCVWGAKQFQLRYPNITCQFSVLDQNIQWCPGDNWRGQQYFEINNPVIQSIYDKYGWAAGQATDGYYGPGFGPGYYR